MATSSQSFRSDAAAVGLRQRILDELNLVIDPCSRATALPAGLVDMGLVRGLKIADQQHGMHAVHVQLCVTHPFCMMPAIFMREVERRLREFPEVCAIEVSLDVTTLWTEELMSGEYRSKLSAQRSEKRL